MLLVAFAFVFSIRSIRVPAEPMIVQVPIEVPVVQEKTVERIVYREKEPRKSKRTQPTPKPESAPTVASLQGFTPAEEVKLTVIKGGSANEK